MIAGFDGFVEADDLLMKLCADSANQKIAMRRHGPQSDGRSVLYLTIRLR